MVHLQELPVPVEGVHYQNSAIQAVVEQTELGKGTLYVTESEISWISSVSGEGFTIQYKKMTLHAISRDENVHPLNCLYIMQNGLLDGAEPEVVESDEEDEIDPVEIITEIKFVPDEAEILPALYNAIQDCALLNPDSASDMTDEDEDEEDFEDGGDGDGENGIGIGPVVTGGLFFHGHVPDYRFTGDNPVPGLVLYGAGDGPRGRNGTEPVPGQFDDAEEEEDDE